MSIAITADNWLEHGDHLSRDEFHRRYKARPDIHKAELIRGVVFVPSPTRPRDHGRQHSISVFWLNSYVMHHPVAEVYDNSSLFLEEDSEVQPDIYLVRFVEPQAIHTESGYIQGAPELVMEVSASSVSYDLHEKLSIYRDVGVQEYIVWRVLDKAIDWFRLRDGEYVALQPDSQGIIHSEVFPGLRLAVRAMLSLDRKGITAALAQQS